MKIMLVALLLATVSTNVFAKSILETLPFGVTIGVTTQDEIESRGFCQKYDQLTGKRCELFKISGGKFAVGLSENKIVSSVIFSAPTAVLPTAWQQLGIGLSNATWEVYKDDYNRMSAVSGTSIEKFMDIVEELGAQNLKVTIKSSYSFAITREVSFYIGAYFFVASFDRLPPFNGHPEKDLGLFEINITENY